MTIKQYQSVRIVVVIIIAMTTSIAINLENFLIPIIAIAIGMIVLTVAKQKVKGVLADERDYNLAGTAARYSLMIFSIIMVIGFFGLMVIKDKNPEFANISALLAYLACGLMIINSLAFRFLKIKDVGDQKGFTKNIKHYLPFILLAFFLALVLTVATLRMFTPEDEWICQDGLWTKHGNPDASMPTKECR